MISAFVQQWLNAVLAVGTGWALAPGRPPTLSRALAVVLGVWAVVFLASLIPLPSPWDFLVPVAIGAGSARFALRAFR